MLTTTLYCPISTLLSANWSGLLQEVKSKRKFQTCSSKSGCGSLREVFTYSLSQTYCSDMTWELLIFWKTVCRGEVVATGGSTVQILLRYTVTVFRYCQSFCNQELFGNTLRTLLVCLLLSSEEIHGHLQVNLRSYPPSRYLDAGKESMIHLLVGSYV